MRQLVKVAANMRQPQARHVLLHRLGESSERDEIRNCRGARRRVAPWRGKAACRSRLIAASRRAIMAHAAGAIQRLPRPELRSASLSSRTARTRKLCASRIASAGLSPPCSASREGRKRRRHAMILCRLKDEIACNSLGGPQYPQHKGANGARQAGEALRQAGKGEQQGDDALEHPPVVLDRRIPVHRSLSSVPAVV